MNPTAEEATTYYDGPVCFGQDGWHYTVVPDDDAREYALAVAEASLKHKKATGNDADIALAQAELDEVKNDRKFEKPGERLHLEDRHVGVDSGDVHGELLTVDGVQRAAVLQPAPENGAAPPPEPGEEVKVESRYRLATDADERSWQDRKSKRIVSAESGLTTEDLEQLLAERKIAEGGQQ